MSNQDAIIHDIVEELKKIPEEYLKNLHEIVHIFRKNIPETIGDNKIWQEIEEETRERRQYDEEHRTRIDKRW